MTTATKEELADLIVARIARDEQSLRSSWEQSGPVRHCVIDDLLDDDLAHQISAAFPAPDQLMLRDSIRERKRVGVQVEKYPPLAGAALYAFQEPQVIEAVRRVTGQQTLLADPSLYAAGLSVMARDDFLGIHIDNSHDGDREVYRVLNLLYYVAPGWVPQNGGNLELWDRKVRTATALPAQFNRLVLMETDRTSWHSVTRIDSDSPRKCISNYYFSPDPPHGEPYRHLTTFTGRPDEPLKRARLFATDRVGRNTLAKVARLAPGLVGQTKHRRGPQGS